MDDLAMWVRERGIAEVECLVPDINGVLRGKVLPAAKLLQSLKDGSLRLPSSVFQVTVTGDYAGSADDAPQTTDAEVIQADTVLPGLWDCHGHFLGTPSRGLSPGSSSV